MQSKAGKIASILTKAILDHRLHPGDTLGERELSETFGVSRIVVKQALIELVESGLVNIQRNRGAFISKPSLQEALEIYDALTMLEQSVAEMLAERVNSTVLGELKLQTQKQRRAAEAGNDDLATKLGKDFHTLLVRLSRNKVLEEIHTQLLRRAALLSNLFNRSFDACTFAKDHERIIELIEDGDAVEVKRLIQNHNLMIARSHDMESESVDRINMQDALQPYLTETKVK